MGAWDIVVYGMLPVPIFLCALVAAPLPRKSSKICCQLADNIIGFRIADTPVIKFLIAASFALFIVMTIAISKPLLVNKLGDANSELNARARRWRTERNFWITSFIMAMWIMLFVTYKLRKRILKLEQQVEIDDAPQPPDEPKKAK
mmetsp:Transcript_47415/g.90536  ORF Transcript_47415/g.90536 Transcript_47415/m.90536 type:complete len:146 (+) Transcript_47415:132-569(+)|eukprot:CAMPEP_0114225034 /NCGR_PEP_ID=MMETSP0058-20121206/439_1 /TAXON_ID=36894 /ORGANISM="Pyramimonas parkeae, CCMP726" /LENGTH=145 /DNA_ID=CAMNT_0001335577 /DNA_START=123 /DNA_END=560 /DNA_ORIENTATION=+